MLDSELGVSPSAELTRLQRAVLASRHGDAPAPRPVPAAAPKKRTPERFLGRSALLTVLLDPNPLPVVHVVGPSGAGKSAFLAELARHAPDRVGIGTARRRSVSCGWPGCGPRWPTSAPPRRSSRSSTAPTRGASCGAISST
jgi:hypothetical protein